METNMVRAGVVEHPSMWSFSGYNEIQEPRRKKVLIDYEKLQSYVVAVSYEQLKRNHRGWVEDCLGNGEKPRHEKWTRSIAVGGKSFVNNVKTLLGVRARGKEVIEGDEGYQLREGSEVYDAHFEPENRNIGLENSYFWGVNHE
jgi:putative transposase